MAKRKWKRWALLVMPKSLVRIARKKGMVCICCFKVSMFVHTQIGLYGSSEQMRATEEGWIKKGYEFTNRKPSHAYSINVNIPKQKWVDALPPEVKQ